MANTPFGGGTVTAAGAQASTLDTSAKTGDFTVGINVTALTAGAVAVIAIEDTANASAFSDAVQVAVFHFQGPIVANDPVAESKRQYEILGTRFGAANTKLRTNVLSLSGTSPSLTFSASLTQ